jgi:signal transduction histidine kinase
MLKGLELKLQNKGLEEATDAGKIQGLVFKTINHAHNVAKGLASMDWRGDDLSEALTGLATHVKNLFGITCGFKLTGEIPSLSEDVVSQLYKIAQEAVTNAVKHGQSKHVEIALTNDTRKMVLTIKNDGLPFPAKERANGRMGMHIMNHRASVINATLNVRANGRRGTVVTCALSHKNGAEHSWAAGDRTGAKSRTRPALVQA